MASRELSAELHYLHIWIVPAGQSGKFLEGTHIKTLQHDTKTSVGFDIFRLFAKWLRG